MNKTLPAVLAILLLILPLRVALAADTTIQLGTGDNFVVQDSGATPRLIVDETTGKVLIGDAEIANAVIGGMPNQGDVWYDNGTTITRLPPGAAGEFLQTGGAAANPAWATGPTGPQGPQGIQGPEGPPGPVNTIVYQGPVTVLGNINPGQSASVQVTCPGSNPRVLGGGGLLTYTAGQTVRPLAVTESRPGTTTTWRYTVTNTQITIGSLNIQLSAWAICAE